MVLFQFRKAVVQQVLLDLSGGQRLVRSLVPFRDGNALYRGLVFPQADSVDVSRNCPQDITQPLGFDINVVRWVRGLLV